MHHSPRLRSCTLAVILLAWPALLNAAESDGTGKPSVALREANWKQIQAEVAAHRGKVVVLDVWTTTCPSCIEELPKFVRLARKHREGVLWLTVNCDYDGIRDKPPAFYKPDALTALKRAGATAGVTENLQLTLPFIDFLEEIELASTPAVLVYGPDGRLAKRFDNDEATSAAAEFSLDDVERLVRKLQQAR